MARLDRRLQKLEAARRPESGVTVLFSPRPGASDEEIAGHQQAVERAKANGERAIVVNFVNAPPRPHETGVEVMSAADAYRVMLDAPIPRPLRPGVTMTAEEACRHLIA